jgi:ferredoxin
MPTIEILASPAGAAVEVEGEGRLIDLCDEARAPVEFSCRSANCGTCRVEVLAGAVLLDPPGWEELRVLASATPRPEEAQRLACQVVVRPGGGLVRLRWLGP